MRIERSSLGPPEDLLPKLRSLASGAAWSEAAEQSLSSRILEAVAAVGGEDEELLRAVFELAVHSDPNISRRGQRLLFSTIAETLGDSFDARAVAVHDRVLSSVIEFCRHHPGMSFLDMRLRSLGITNRSDCLARRAALASRPPLTAREKARIRKVCVLSRVTLGADVAVTSIVLQMVRRLFPHAATRLIGPAGAGQILSGLAGTILIECEYDRRGLIDRLRSWYDATRIVEQETTGLEDAESLVIDPDSRLTQLGLLPIARPTIPYLFFESRTYRAAGLETLGELTEHWLNHVLPSGNDESTYPRVALSSHDVARAEALVRVLKGRGGGVAAMNVGVGGNARKRIHGSFELQLARGILAEGSTLVIDHGAGEDEARVAAIVDGLRSDGRQVVDADGLRFAEGPLPLQCDVLAYRGPVGPFAALVGASDVYVGYDSAFQHIAAAQRVPVIDIFVDPPNPVFPMRWRPHSTATVTTIQTTPESAGSGAALAEVFGAVRRLLSVGSRHP